jgi:hypothetical protein
MNINTLIVSSFILSISFTSFSQQILRSTIGSIGSSMGNGTVTIQQTAGQPAVVGNQKSENTGIRQGFVQPMYFEEEQNELNVLLYPNPNRGEFSFTVNENSDEQIDFMLFDQQGKILVENTTLPNQLTPISIENPSPGMYHLKVISGKRFSSFKVNVIQ